MVIPVVLLKRLEALECQLDCRDEIKVFMYYPEEKPPYWNPESPEIWQQAHPKGHAVILEVRDCGIKSY